MIREDSRRRNIHNANNRKSLYCRSGIIVFSITVLLLSTPVLTGFMSSSHSSFVTNKYDER